MPEQKCPKECEDCIHCEVCGMVHADKGEPCAFQEHPITSWMQELIKADQEGRCIVLKALPALKPGKKNAVELVDENGERYMEYVTCAEIGENSEGKLVCTYSTIDGEEFREEIGKGAIFNRYLGGICAMLQWAETHPDFKLDEMPLLKAIRADLEAVRQEIAELRRRGPVKEMPWHPEFYKDGRHPWPPEQTEEKGVNHGKGNL